MHVFGDLELSSVVLFTRAVSIVSKLSIWATTVSVQAFIDDVWVAAASRRTLKAYAWDIMSDVSAIIATMWDVATTL